MLVATLWVLAAITIGAAFFSDQVSRSREAARMAQQSARTMVDIENTRAEMLFRICTYRPSQYGLGDASGAIRLDDRAYRGTGEDRVRLQDYGGLVNANLPNRELLFGLIGQLGVPAARRDAMLDALFDYTDPDDLRRLNGAEAREYSAARLPPPPNDWMTSPYQLRNVLHWRSPPFESETFTRFFSTGGTVGININSAPLEVLASLPGNTRQIAILMAGWRAQKPFESPFEAAQRTGNPLLEGETIGVVPGAGFRITQYGRNLPWMVEYGITVTPSSPSAPWRVDYYSKRVLDTPIENEKDVAPLPNRISQPAAPAETL